MGHHENIWLENCKASKIIFYRRYVDDTFCVHVFETEQDALSFFDFINTRHRNIRFTMEKEVDHKIPFLDVFIHSHSQGPTTTVFHKKTFTGLLTNYFSQESMKVREVIPYIDPVPIVIPLKLFLDLLRDPVFPRGYLIANHMSPFYQCCVGIRSPVNFCKNGDIYM